MRRVLGSGVLALSLLAPSAAAPETSVQEALLGAKPAVAIVVAEVGGEVTMSCVGREVRVTPTPVRETGTGWFVDPNGWLVTNAHVISLAHDSSASARAALTDRAAAEKCPSDAGARQNAKVKLEPDLFVILSNGIRLKATVEKYSPPIGGNTMSGQDLALLRLEAADMPTLDLGDSATARIGDRIYILGFPGVVMTHELLNASAKVEASVTNGAISGFKQDVANQPVIQTDAPAALGNSGGPAVGADGRVLGVLTFASGGSAAESVQGFNFVIPVAAVQEFIKGTGAKPRERSRFNVAWRGGLHEYFSGNYRAAQKHFVEANRLVPELPDVRRTMAETDEKIKNPPPRPFPWALVAAMVTGVSVAAFGVIGGMRWKRNRFRIRPSEVAYLLETAPERPIILDVRDPETYRRSPVRIPESIHLAPEQLQQRVGTLAIEPQRTVVAYCT